MEIPTIMPRGEAFLISPCKLYKFASDIYRDTKNVNLKIDILNTNVYSKENISKHFKNIFSKESLEVRNKSLEFIEHGDDEIDDETYGDEFFDN